MTKTSDAELDIYVKSVLGKKAQNPILLDVRHLTSLADAFLICEREVIRGKVEPLKLPDGLQCERSRQYGQALLEILRVKET